MGVFLAEERRLVRRVVVKVLSPEIAADVSTERFEREIRVAAKLQDPRIVPRSATAPRTSDWVFLFNHLGTA